MDVARAEECAKQNAFTISIYIAIFKRDSKTLSVTDEKHNGKNERKIEDAEGLFDERFSRKESSVIILERFKVRTRDGKQRSHQVSGRCSTWTDCWCICLLWLELFVYLRRERELALEPSYFFGARNCISKLKGFQPMTTLSLSTASGYEDNRSI